jgi:hypothetical protein
MSQFSGVRIRATPRKPINSSLFPLRLRSEPGRIRVRAKQPVCAVHLTVGTAKEQSAVSPDDARERVSPRVEDVQLVLEAPAPAFHPLTCFRFHSLHGGALDKNPTLASLP